MLNTIFRRLGQFLGLILGLVIALLPTYVAVAAGWFTGMVVGTTAPPTVAIVASLAIGFWAISVLRAAWFLRAFAVMKRLSNPRSDEFSNWLFDVGGYAWKGGQTGGLTTGTLSAIVAGSGAWKGADASSIFALIVAGIVVGVVGGILFGRLAVKRKRNIAASVMEIDKIPALRLLVARRARAMRNLNDDLLAMPREFQTTVVDATRFYGDLSPEDQAQVFAIAQAIDNLPPKIREALL